MSSASTPPPRTRRRRSRLGLVLFVLVTMFVVGEVAVRVLPVEAFSEQRLVRDLSNMRYEAHPYLAYAGRPHWTQGPPGGPPRFQHNSLGFRGDEMAFEKPPGVYRIACLGGSSTYGHGPSSNAATWPAQLQTMLNGRQGGGPRVEVLNAGTSGYSTFESLVNLAIRVIQFDPDLVLVYHSINDVRLWRWPGVRYDNTHFRAVWPVVERSWLEKTLEKSRLYLLLQDVLFGVADQDLGHWVIRDYHEKEFLRQTIQPEGPEYFTRNLRSIVALCHERDIAVMFGKQAWFRDDFDNYADKGGMEHAARLVQGTADALGVPVADIDGAMPQERHLFTNGVHVTDAGAQRIASTWAKAILDAGLLEKR